MIVLDWKALANDALTPGNHQRGWGLFIDIGLVLIGKALSTWNNPVSIDENRNNTAAFCSVNVEPTVWSQQSYKTDQI